MAFSKEKFDIMVDELLYREPISFTMLAEIVEETLRGKVFSWCEDEDCLRGRKFEDDIMQLIHVRMMAVTIPGFLLRNGVNGPVNNDPRGFKSWMFKVAENLKKDFANSVRSADFKQLDITDPKVIYQLPRIDEAELEQTRARLTDAFEVVMNADVKVYKVLTWIAQFLFVIGLNVTKIQSNEVIVEAFGKKTLFEMYLMLMAYAKRISWMEISPQMQACLQQSLQKPFKDGKTYGEIQYDTFFMLYKGTKDGKKSISDWVNRMNEMVQKKLGNKNTGGEGI